MSLSVGMGCPVKGRLPHGWRIEAHFDSDTGILKLSSPDTDHFRIMVDSNKMDEYSPEHKKTSDQLDQESSVEAKYDVESGVLRFDSPDLLEFWIEVHVKNMPEMSRNKQKTSTEEDDNKNEEEAREEEDYEMMPWSKIEVDDGILTLWPNTSVREADLHGPNNIHKFFMKAFGIEVIPVGCVETLPDVDESGENIEGTGGRHDFFFFVKMADVPKFAIKRFQFGMRWWADIYFNNGEDIYPPDFLEAYPDTAE